jgi:Fe-S-cluster containining protein
MVSIQECRQCGRCCEKWGWDQKGVVDDIIPWIRKNRQDILQHIVITFTDGTKVNGTRITERDLQNITQISYWTDSEGRVMTRCPFYRLAGDGKVYCGIHDLKPRVCIGFTPWNEGIRDYALNCPACRETSP